MVEQVLTDKDYNATDSIIDILLKANENRDFEEATKMQKVELNDLIEQLIGLSTELERLDLLIVEYVSLFFFVCRVKQIETKEFREFFKNLDTENHPELMVYYIHGWLHHHFDDMRKQNKLHKGKEGKYEGELDENNKFYGQGVRTFEGGDKLEGTFVND